MKRINTILLSDESDSIMPAALAWGISSIFDDDLAGAVILVFDFFAPGAFFTRIISIGILSCQIAPASFS